MSENKPIILDDSSYLKKRDKFLLEQEEKLDKIRKELEK